MIKLREDQLTVWDVLLPEPFRSLPEELSKIDALLDDLSFMKPFIDKHPSKRGRPTVPAETYLHLMYLKFRYNLGYETLVKEVGDSMTWRRFCRIAIDAKMPDATTLIKARKRYGNDMVDQLNEALLLKLQEKEILKTRKIRIDTTVVESDVHHPTDATLLQDGVKVITRLISRVRKVASHAVQGFQDCTAEVKKEILFIAKLLRRRTQQSLEEINAITDKVAMMTEIVCDQAQKVVEKISDKSKSAAQAMKTKLCDAVNLTLRLVNQAKEVVSGNRNIPDRIVSFFDPEARPIKKGKLAKTTEFGYKLRVDENEDGLITGYELYNGNPSDDDLLVPAIEQHISRFGTAPNAVATDPWIRKSQE